MFCVRSLSLKKPLQCAAGEDTLETAIRNSLAVVPKEIITKLTSGQKKKKKNFRFSFYYKIYKYLMKRKTDKQTNKRKL